MKRCTGCKIPQPYKNFSKRSATKDGYDYQCKTCRKSQNDLKRDRLREKDKKSYYKNRKARIAKARKYGYINRGTPIPQDVIEIVSQHVRKVVSHIDAYAHTLAKHKERRESNPDEHKRKNREWAKTPNGRLNGRLKAQRYKARKRSLPDTFSKSDFEFLLWFQKGKCGSCKRNFGESLKPEVDHIVPASLNGEFSLNNAQLLCRSCNASKQDSIIRYIPIFNSSDMEEWRVSLCQLL